ncbi:hypothetical protein BVC80_1787g144 [Macleaya cordata]|uniref:Uncharacterized protein n=1 Tax=Macleaya cordata TaxID=56857 RepID=A0A200QUF1_MACCD|nr:hypothetical protein BVC80_1787g144 [Macleaya cordata]
MKWNPLHFGVIKINVDGATNPGSIAIGVVARSHTGDVITGYYGFDGNWCGTDAALEAEAESFL